MTHQEAVDTLAAERYLLDDMPEEQRQSFEDHFFSCELCADEMRIAAAMVQGAKAGFAGPSSSGRVVPMVLTPSVVRAPAWYRSVALPWAVAASLAVVAGYQTLQVSPAQPRDASPVALVPITLRPQSRGAEAIVPVGSRSQPTILAIEVNDPPQGAEVAYDLTTTDGRRVASGSVAAPAPGAPLLLLVPSSTLIGPMHYILSIRDTGPSSRMLGEYRFEVPAH